MVRIQKSRKKLQAEVDEFNLNFSVGTEVQYWTGIREGEGKKGVTRSAAELLQGHTPVVWIEGCSGCVALSHVLPCVAPEAPEELTPDMKFRK